jgi:uncharacterized protein YneF (UPF0154 family)
MIRIGFVVAVIVFALALAAGLFGCWIEERLMQRRIRKQVKRE